jgi:hypothetical protein
MTFFPVANTGSAGQCRGYHRGYRPWGGPGAVVSRRAASRSSPGCSSGGYVGTCYCEWRLLVIQAHPSRITASTSRAMVMSDPLPAFAAPVLGN